MDLETVESGHELVGRPLGSETTTDKSDVKCRVLDAVGFSTASASALPLPIAIILLVAIPLTKLEAPHHFQNPGSYSSFFTSMPSNCIYRTGWG